MPPLTLGLPSGPLTVLCLGAHADDIEIGCGGTVMQLLAERRRVTVHWVVLSANARRADEARRSAARLLRGALAHHVHVFDARDGFFPYESGAALKEQFERLKTIVDPDVVFTHQEQDAHQDHGLVAALTRQTFRDHLILQYEIPKYDGDLGQPNVFVPLASAIRRRKIRHLMSAFPSQRGKRWYSEETFNGLMRLRGVECAAPDGYAEAFLARKLVVDLRSRSTTAR
jgi:LmbE family N-acetylglucosaminyl deacetylase